MVLVSSADFFQNLFLSGIPSKRQTVWIQIRNDILSVLLWVETVSIGYDISKGQKSLLASKCK